MLVITRPLYPVDVAWKDRKESFLADLEETHTKERSPFEKRVLSLPSTCQCL